jgi:hypothetical protein
VGQKPSDLEVTLSVLYALEDGPVVCKVSVKNVGIWPVHLAYYSRSTNAYCNPLTEWKPRGKPFRAYGFIGMVGYGTTTLDPGVSESHTFDLHPDFLVIPAGNVPIRFGWHVYRLVPSKSEDRVFKQELELVFRREGIETVKVLPATQENVSGTLCGLEAEFHEAAERLAGETDYCQRCPDPADEFVKRIAGCRHKEFVPLLLRALDRLPSQQHRSKLVGAVYESFPTPEEGFAALAEYLSSSQPASAGDLFDFWCGEARKHESQKQWRSGLDPAKAAEEARLLRECFGDDEAARRPTRRHDDVRLSKGQFARLLVMENVWVRALLYAHFPDECPAEWVSSLFVDLDRLGSPPQRLGELLAALDDEEFEVRERASAELIASGSKLGFFLWTVPTEGLSPEAALRLRLVREQVEKPALPLLWQRVLSLLAEDPRPHTQKMLAILLSPGSRSPIAPAARESVLRHRQRLKYLEELEQQRDELEKKRKESNK